MQLIPRVSIHAYNLDPPAYIDNDTCVRAMQKHRW